MARTRVKERKSSPPKAKKQRSKRSKIAHPWDFWLKELARQEPQALVSLLLPGAVFLGTIDKELRGRTVEADLLFRVVWRGVEIILHIEFQCRADKDMAHRVWEYNVMTRCVEPYPVYSVVIYLTQRDGIVESPYILEDVPGETVHVFFFHNLKLWEVSPEEFKREGSEGLLALLPLTAGGNNREVVEEMIAELKARDRTDLLPLGWVFAGLALEGSDDKEWLKERFTAMKDLFQESQVYQLIVQEGSLQQLRQILVHYVQKRFPVLAPLAQEQVALIEDMEILQNMLDAIYDAQAVEEVRRILEEARPSRS